MFPKKTLHAKLLPILSLILILASTFSVVSTSAASLNFTPATQSFVSGCTASVDIEVDATGENSNAADMEVSYNPEQIEIVDSNGDIPGTQIKNGNAYESYVENRVIPSEAKIYLAAVSTVTTVTGKRVFGTIYFKNKSGVSSTEFKIRLDGVGELVTFDSNIADTTTSKDILKSVTNGNYSFNSGFCEKEPPKITFQNPVDRQKSVNVDSVVNIKITDNESGVDIDTVQFNINGDVYTSKSPEVTYAGDPLAYSFSIRPKNKFYEDKESSITVTALDKAGNRANSKIIFDPPFICNPVAPIIINKPADIIINKPADIIVTSPEPQTPAKDPEKPAPIQQIINTAYNGGSSGTGTTSDASIPISSLFYYILLAIGNLLLVILGFLLSNKHRKLSGIAIDAVTGKPIEIAPIKIFDLVTKEFLSSHETDQNGKYVFHLLPGDYELKIDYKGIKWSQTYSIPEVDKIKNLSTFVAASKETNREKLGKYARRVKIFLAKLAPGMWLSGFILSILNLYLIFSPLNIIITSIYILVFILVFLIPFIYRKYLNRNFEKFDN